MNIRTKLKLSLSKRSQQTLTVAFSLVTTVLIACGGGAGSAGGDVASLPGTGGTGITAMGPVSGFGSVIVNGTRFDDSNAQVFIDGDIQTTIPATSGLRLGMVANVMGVKSNAMVTTTAVIKALGTADNIEVWSIAQGTITSLGSSTTFTVAGMSMVVDAGTVFEGAMSIRNLNTSTIVKLWGQPITADFKQWSVTRLQVLSKASSTISTGKVMLRGSTPTVNGLALVGSDSTLANGQLVRVVGSLTSTMVTNTLTVSKITTLGSSGTTASPSGYSEIEGIVTSVLTNNTTTTTPAKVTRMTLGASEIDTKDAVIYPAGASIAAGKRVEVQGSWSAGILLATSVTIKSSTEAQEVEIEAAIEVFTSLSDFMVRGQRCDASGLTRVNGGKLSDLAVGKRVHLHGVKNGDVVRITELELK
jgi:Domain of unknown function (DUF5666)